VLSITKEEVTLANNADFLASFVFKYSARNPAQNTSPAPVQSTALFGRVGTLNLSVLVAAIHPFAPSVTIPMLAPHLTRRSTIFLDN